MKSQIVRAALTTALTLQAEFVCTVPHVREGADYVAEVGREVTSGAQPEVTWATIEPPTSVFRQR